MPLAVGYIEGVQSAGVSAVVKHFVLNSQETNRETVDPIVSDRVLWEVCQPLSHPTRPDLAPCHVQPRTLPHPTPHGQNIAKKLSIKSHLVFLRSEAA